MAFFHVGGNAGEVQEIESQIEEGFGSFRCKAASPVGAGDVVPQSDSGAVVGGVESAAADVFPVSFENCGPHAEGFVWVSNVSFAETAHGFFHGPGTSAYVAADFGVGVHGDEVVLVFNLVGAEEEASGFEKDHINGQWRVNQDGDKFKWSATAVRGR